MNPITTRLAQRLLGIPLIRNSIRGDLVGEMVAVALEPEWQLCAGDWAAFDLKQADGPLRIQVKQSAARQGWHATMSPVPPLLRHRHQDRPLGRADGGSTFV